MKRQRRIGVAFLLMLLGTILISGHQARLQAIPMWLMTGISFHFNAN